MHERLKLNVESFVFHLKVLCSYLLDDGSDVTQKHRGKTSHLDVVIYAYIQWLKHKRLSNSCLKTVNVLDNVVFIKVVALDLSEHGDLETQASLTLVVLQLVSV